MQSIMHRKTALNVQLFRPQLTRTALDTPTPPQPTPTPHPSMSSPVCVAVAGREKLCSASKIVNRDHPPTPPTAHHPANPPPGVLRVLMRPQIGRTRRRGRVIFDAARACVCVLTRCCQVCYCRRPPAPALQSIDYITHTHSPLVCMRGVHVHVHVHVCVR